jgi:hypothetical protein
LVVVPEPASLDRDDGKVSINGEVRSWAEREKAEKVAWREDQLRVAV